jgi:hypothetical protein
VGGAAVVLAEEPRVVGVVMVAAELPRDTAMGPRVTRTAAGVGRHSLRLAATIAPVPQPDASLPQPLEGLTRAAA